MDKIKFDQTGLEQIILNVRHKNKCYRDILSFVTRFTCPRAHLSRVFNEILLEINIALSQDYIMIPYENVSFLI